MDNIKPQNKSSREPTPTPTPASESELESQPKMPTETLAEDSVRYSELVVNPSPLLPMTRREFMLASAATGALMSAPQFARALETGETAADAVPIQPLTLKLNVNGLEYDLVGLDPRTTLLDALRENLGLTGSKKGCDHGQCGACTILVNGRRINSCLSLAAQNAGKKIKTIEGLAEGGRLHPMQQAFIEEDAFQCGFCTPGQIMSAVGLLNEKCGTEETEVRECMSGNLCRCGAYRNILSAISKARSGVKNAAV